MKIDKSIIKELSDYLEEFNLTEIEITEKDTKIKVSKNNVSINNQPTVTSANISTGNENVSEKPNVKSGTEITSPIIGTAYHAPEPGAKAMKNTPRLGLDAFCQKLLIYENQEGDVWVAFNDITELSKLYYETSTLPQRMIDSRLNKNIKKSITK